MRFGCVVALVALLVGVGPLRSEDLTEIPLRIPMVEAGPEGLEALVILPEGGGRHPLSILSHGSPRDAASRPGMSATGMRAQLIEFARRGFVAASVLRRG